MSVTQLLGLGLTPGKVRGLTRISNPDGTFTMLALDQNNSMLSMARESLKRRGEDRDATYEEIVEAKVELVRELAPQASAVLLDAVYGAWNSLASFTLPRNTGLLVRVEKSGARRNDQGGVEGEIEPGWSVEQIKRMGADAVKLLVQYEPAESASAEHQFALVQKVADECRRHDILFLLEATGYTFPGEKKDTASYLNRKAETVIESARQLSRWCDIYKAEFPGTLGHENEKRLQQNLKELNAASQVPWVLLSAGVDYDDYRRQVEMALANGASGVLGGRAFWKEYFTHDTAEERRRFCREVVLRRLTEIDTLVKEKGTPWFRRYGRDLATLNELRAAEGWYFRYGAAPTDHRFSDPADRSGDY